MIDFAKLFGITGDQAPAAEPSYSDVPLLQQRAKRAQMLADALRQGSQFSDQSQMVSGRVVPVGLGQSVAKLLQAHLAGQQDQRSQELQGQAQGLTQGQLQRELERFQAASQLDPQSAAMQAMSSPFPQLRKMGEDTLKNYQSMQEFGTRPTNTPDGLIVTNKAGQVKVLPHKGVTDGKLGVRPVARPDGMWQDYVTLGDGSVDTTKPVGAPYARGPNASSITNTIGDKADLEVVKQLANTVNPGGKSYDKAEAAVRAVQGANEALASLDQGVKSGIATPTAQILRKVGTAIGIPNAEAAPADVLDSALKQNVMNTLGSLGTAISDGDRRFVEGSMGSLTTEPFALKRLLALQVASNLITVSRHNDRVRGLSSKVDPALLEGANLNAQTNISDPDVNKMIENVLQGKETTAGLKVPAKTTATSQAKVGINYVPGMVRGGYRFKGGDPKQQANWEPVQ